MKTLLLEWTMSGATPTTRDHIVRKMMKHNFESGRHNSLRDSPSAAPTTPTFEASRHNTRIHSAQRSPLLSVPAPIQINIYLMYYIVKALF